MKKIIGSYRNGDYMVYICNDGTKLRYSPYNNFHAQFPESIDLKISNRCNLNCPMCHEQSTAAGKLANLNHPLLDSLRPYTELALGGGNVFEHPDLENFLHRMKEQKVICNLTVNEQHFVQYSEILKKWHKEELIHGIGVSIINNTSIAMWQDCVIHAVLGITPISVITSCITAGAKILLLGYKDFGRGKRYKERFNKEIQSNINEVKKYIIDNYEEISFISFDNLALEQLDIKSIVSPEEWERLYMGDDGSYTMYVDLVEEEYAISSISPRFKIDSNCIDDLFNKL